MKPNVTFKNTCANVEAIFLCISSFQAVPEPCVSDLHVSTWSRAQPLSFPTSLPLPDRWLKKQNLETANIHPLLSAVTRLPAEFEQGTVLNFHLLCRQRLSTVPRKEDFEGRLLSLFSLSVHTSLAVLAVPLLSMWPVLLRRRFHT